MVRSTWLTTVHGLARDLVGGLVQLVYPGICVVCRRSLGNDAGRFCPSCRAALTVDPHATCPRCAATVGPFVPLDDGCTHCRDHAFQFERVVRLGPYEGVLRDVILRMKHSAGESVAELLGVLWAEHAGAQLRSLHADVVVPVPLHWRRRWRRGYNQSEAVATGLATVLALPSTCSWLRRLRNTPQQTVQTSSQRRENVRGAFHARPARRWRGKTVLLIDDVLTTGSTASEAARALRQGGAGRVLVAVLSRGTGAGKI